MQISSGLLLAAIAGLEGVDGALILASLALAAATFVFIFLIEPDAADSAPHRSRLDQLLERRDTIYENLRDLKFEHRSGKFADRDYEEMKQTLETEAALVLAEIEQVTGGQARPVSRRAANSATQTGMSEKGS